jgi:hypothetical protein
MSTVAVAPPPPTAMAAGERQRRTEAVAHANGHIRLEGKCVSPFMRQLQQLYIEGEITIEGIDAVLTAKYKAS